MPRPLLFSAGSLRFIGHESVQFSACQQFRQDGRTSSETFFSRCLYPRFRSRVFRFCVSEEQDEFSVTGRVFSVRHRFPRDKLSEKTALQRFGIFRIGVSGRLFLCVSFRFRLRIRGKSEIRLFSEVNYSDL